MHAEALQGDEGDEGTHSNIPFLAHLGAVSHARQLNILLH